MLPLVNQHSLSSNLSPTRFGSFLWSEVYTHYMTIQHHFSVLIQRKYKPIFKAKTHTQMFTETLSMPNTQSTQVGDEETTVIDIAIQWNRKILRNENELVLHPTCMASEPQRCPCCMMPLTWFDRTDQQLLSGMIQLGDAGWDTIYGLYLLVTVSLQLCLKRELLAMCIIPSAWSGRWELSPKQINAFQSLLLTKERTLRLSIITPGCYCWCLHCMWLSRYLIYLFPISH